MATSFRYKVSPRISAGHEGVVLGSGANEYQETTHVLLGRLCEQGLSVPVNLSFDRESVVGIFGKRGSGKSYTLGVLLEALGNQIRGSAIGHNVGDRAVLVIDTLNIFQYSVVPVSRIQDDEIRAKMQRDLASFGLSDEEISIDVTYPAGVAQPFYPDGYEPFSIDTSLVRPEDYSHIFAIDLYKDPMGQLLLAASDATKSTGYGCSHGRQEPSEAAGLAELIECIEHDPSMDQVFAASTRRATLARLQGLYRMPLFSGPATPLSSLIRAGRVRLLLLGALSPDLRSVVAALVLRQLFNLRATAAEASKSLKLTASLDGAKREAAETIVAQSPPRTLVCIDEAQGYAPPTKTNPCTGILIQFVKEGRNHGLSLAFTSQQPSAIHQEVLSQLDTLVAHRLTVPADVEATLSNAKGRSPSKIASGQQVLTEKELLRELSEGQALVSHADAPRAFVLEVRPRVTAHGGIEG